MQWIDQREKLRIELWKTLKISFPKMAFRQVINLLGSYKTRILYELLCGGECSYLPYAIGSDFPKDGDQQIRELYEDHNFVSVLSVLRCEWIKSNLSRIEDQMAQNMVWKMGVYLQQLQRCYGLKLPEKMAISGSVKVAKGHLKMAEGLVMQRLEQLPLNDKYLVLCVAALALEEFELGSFEKINLVLQAQRSMLQSLGW